MKKIFVVLLLLFQFVNARAYCTQRGLDVWPSDENITQNPIFVITGYALSQDLVIGLNKTYPVYLQSGTSKIKLTVKEILIGDLRLTQAILIPTEPLKSGKAYQLIIENFPEKEAPVRKWNSTKAKVKWRVEKGEDVVPPVWGRKPKEIKKTLKYWGCGPEAYIHYDYKIIEQHEFLIRTTVTNISKGKSTSFCLVPENSTLFMVGEGMCSGAFYILNGEEFEVSFDIMDASGNITKWTDKKISFTSPTDTDETK